MTKYGEVTVIEAWADKSILKESVVYKNLLVPLTVDASLIRLPEWPCHWLVLSTI